MDLRALRYFVYVAEFRSFSKAAVHLRVAQPAISRQVQKLEQELGTPLVVRAGRGIHLTEAGTVLHNKAQMLLRLASQVAEDVHARRDALSGTVAIGVVAAAGAALIPSVVRECEEQHPGIRLDLSEGVSGYIHERVLNHELTLGILHNPTAHKDLVIHRLMVDHVYLVGPPAGEGPLPPCDAALAAHVEALPLIVPSRPHSLRLLVENTLARQGVSAQVKYQVDGLMMIKALVRAGVGYTVITWGAISEDVAAGTLSAAPLDPWDEWTLSMVHRRDLVNAPVVEAVIRIIRAKVERLIAEGRWRGTRL